MADQQWFYASGNETTPHGPVPLQTLQMLLANGQLGSDARVWMEGMGEWETAAMRPELAQSIPAITPIQPAGSSAFHPLQYQGLPGVLPYAGFWLRFVAYIIDYIIGVVAGFIVGGVIGFIIGAAGAASGNAQSHVRLAIPFIQLSMFGVIWLYYALMESSAMQATLGKMALGLIVTDEAGQRVTFGRATGRYFGKILSGLILLIGFMMAGWTERKQALHDILAHTLVVRRQ
ncbi:MAG: RDD family protein [Phycisphaerae bacterium]|nr:RDD family protein [Phycisphaerae bacterium]